MELTLSKKREAARHSDLVLVCVSFNQKELTRKYLALLAVQTLPPDVIVLDNASTDGSYETFCAEAPQANILRSSANVGATGGYYLAQKYAFEQGYRFIMLGENDAYPVQPMLIETLRSRALLSPEHLHNPINLYKGSAAGFFHATMMSREHIETAGLINPDYFFRGDDHEYVCRMRASGFSLQTHTDLAISHPVTDKGYRNCGALYFATRNDLNNKYIYHSPLELLKSLAVRLETAMTYLLLYGQKDIARAIGLGIADFLNQDMS